MSCYLTFISILILICTSSAVKNLPKLPIYLGRGYNLLEGNPISDDELDPGFEHQILQFTYNKGEETDDGRFLIPDNVSHRKVSSCSLSTEIKEFRGTQSYQKDLKTKISISGGYHGLITSASFSSSASYEKIQNQTLDYNHSITHASASCQAYELSLNLFLVNKLTQNFVLGVLESVKHENWTKFFTQFGSHFVYEAVMGGRSIQQIEYEEKSVSQMESLQIDLHLAAKATFAAFFRDPSFDYQKYQKQISYTKTFSSSIRQLYVGGRAPENGNITQWQQNIIQDPMPVTYKILLLSDLFEYISEPSFNHLQAIMSFYKGLDLYCQENNCKPPTSDKPKPKPATITVQKTEIYGTPGGNPFQWKMVHPTLDARIFYFNSDEEINKIQVALSDGVTTVLSPQFGGDGTTREPWHVPDNQHITQVEIRSADRVDSLTFITNKGNRSPRFGGNGGNYEMLQLPNNFRIIGLYGHSGSRLDQIGFILGKTNYETGEIQIIKQNLRESQE